MDLLINIPTSHLGLFQWCLWVFPVDHTEGNALWFRGESPGNSGTRADHGEAEGAVTAGLYEKFLGAVPKLTDVTDRKGDGETAAVRGTEQR